MSNAASVRQRIVDVLEYSSGLDLGDADDGTDFFELGLDSLFLTQASQAITKQFGVEVTFRQMSDSESSIGALCSYLKDQGVVDAEEPAGATSPDAGDLHAPQDLAPNQSLLQNVQWSSVASGASDSAVEQLIQAQLSLMQQQLNLLSAGATTVAHAVPTTTDGARHSVDQPASSAKPSEPVTDQNKPTAELKGGRGAKITKTSKSPLSDRQRTFIENLVGRYTAKTPSSKSYAQEHRAYLADPRTVSGFNALYKEMIYPLVTNRSKGSKIWDLDGNEYVDHVLGFGPILFGHSPEFIVSAVNQQILDGIETGPQSELTGAVAKLVCELTGVERCAFASTGSEAVLGAIRLARAVTGRSKVVVFDGAYHGIVDEAIYRKGRDGTGLPAAPGIPRESTANLVVLPWNDMAALDVINEFSDDLAAILVEPIQSREPQTQPRELLHRLREICDATGAALIFDEIVTGFRVHQGGAQAFFDIKADLATYGKIIGGGYPLGIIAGNARFMDALDGGHWSFGDDSTPTAGVTYFAGTFVRHPVALAAAHAVLLKLKQSGPALQEDLGAKTTQLAETLCEFLDSVSSTIEVHHCSSWLEINAPREATYMPLFFVLMRLYGFHVQDGRPVFVSTAHTEDELESFVDAFRESVCELILNDLLDGDKLAAHRVLRRNEEEPPVEGALLGRDEDGNPGWFVADPDGDGNFLKVGDA
ncbi:MAG: aminotransferase class III-fold pyridoxal phosphate-dependent enzyme [Pseudomonadota bacterium]